MYLQGCAFTTLVINTPALHSLDLRDSQKISDVALRSMLTQLTSLGALNLSYIVPLSDDTLREVCARLFSHANLPHNRSLRVYDVNDVLIYAQQGHLAVWSLLGLILLASIRW